MSQVDCNKIAAQIREAFALKRQFHFPAMTKQDFSRVQANLRES